MLAMKYRKAVTREIQDRYKEAAKKTKTKILDEFCTTTGYNRTYAARILRLKVGKVIGYAIAGGKKIKYVIGKKKKTKKKRARIYGYDVFLKLKKIWAIFDFTVVSALLLLWKKL